MGNDILGSSAENKFLEQGEAAAERYADEHGDPVTGKIACIKCGKMVDATDAWPSSASPYSPPICGKCLFVCSKCGKEVSGAPLSGEAICETCCEDHIYDYDPGERQSFCRFCCQPRPNDWSFDD